METDKTKIAVNVFDKCAQLYADKFMDVSLYHESFDWFCDAIEKQNASVLELGCGPGNITKYLLDKRPDLKILATDLAPKMLAIAQTNNPEARFELLDCRELGNLEQKFDAVMCGFCLPYLSKEDAQKLIAAASEILQPGGILYLSTMEDEYAKSSWEKGSTGDAVFMHYHEEAYLVESIEANGFTIIRKDRKQYDYPNGKPVTDLILITKK